MPSELSAIALLTATIGVLLAISVLLSRYPGRVGVPLTLFFIAIGMLAGSEGIGGIAFEDYPLTFRVGTIALALILFDGGLNTSLSSIRLAIRPAIVLATVGVVLTAAVLAGVARLAGLSWPHALLLGAVVSSTDAAAVFAVLRGSGLHLRKRVGTTLELESGLNDPMAVILTVSLTHALVSGEGSWGMAVVNTVIQLVVGAVAGWAIGEVARFALRRVQLPAAGLYPVFTLAVALVAFGVTTLLQGSGFLAVYVAGVVLGNALVRYRAGLLRVHDAIAWLSQVAMFVLLGLLAFPSQLVASAPIGLVCGLALAVIARPVAVWLSLLPFRFPLRERAYVSWVGLRGAVPIILATIPVLSAVPGAREIFNIVFFIVVVNALLPGATVPWVTKKLGLVSQAPAPPPAALELSSTQVLDSEVLSFYIHAASAASGARLADLPFPPSAVAALVIRGNELLAPRGTTELRPGDHVYVFAKQEDIAFLTLIFGQQDWD